MGLGGIASTADTVTPHSVDSVFSHEVEQAREMAQLLGVLPAPGEEDMGSFPAFMWRLTDLGALAPSSALQVILHIHGAHILKQSDRQTYVEIINKC